MTCPKCHDNLYIEEVKDIHGKLMYECAYCGKQFYPTLSKERSGYVNRKDNGLQKKQDKAVAGKK